MKTNANYSLEYILECLTHIEIMINELGFNMPKFLF